MDARRVPNRGYYNYILHAKYLDVPEESYDIHVEDDIVLDFPGMEKATEIYIQADEEYSFCADEVIRIAAPLPVLKRLELCSGQLAYEDLAHLEGVSISGDISFTQPGSHVLAPTIDLADCHIIFCGEGPFYIDLTACVEPISIACESRVEYIAANKINYIRGTFGIIEADVKYVARNSCGTILGTLEGHQDDRIVVTTRAEYGVVNVPRFKGAS